MPVDSSLELKMSEVENNEEDDTEETLEQLLSHTDIEDPQTKNIIDIYKDQMEIEDEYFMSLLTEKLDDMLITWSQPWYQECVSLTRPLTQDENIPFKTGRITLNEAEKIQKNWRKFIRKYDLPNQPASFARWRAKKSMCKKRTPQEKARHYVTSFLSRGLERSLPQVYKYFITKHAHTVKGPYSAGDITAIKVCMRHYPDSATVVASYILNRDPRQIYNKIAELTNGKSSSRRVKEQTSWNLNSASKFLESLLRHSGLTLEELKYKEIEKRLWSNMAEELGKDALQLKNFWYLKLHQQLFLEKPYKLRGLRKQIFMKLADKLDIWRVWSDINWKDLTREFPEGITKEFIYHIAYRPFRYNRAILKGPLGEAIEYASKKLARGVNRRMKLLQVNGNGTLIPKNEE